MVTATLTLALVLVLFVTKIKVAFLSINPDSIGVFVLADNAMSSATLRCSL